MTTNTNTPAAEAAEIAALIPNPYSPGYYYPVEYAGRKFHAAKKVGRGNQSRKTYLHILTPCTIVLKSPTGEIIDKHPGQKHYTIKLHDAAASWKELDYA